MKTCCGYKFDTSVAKAAKLVTEYCPNFCPYCFSGKQNIEHWIVLCPAFNEIRSSESDKIKRIREFFDHKLSNNNNSRIPNIYLFLLVGNGHYSMGLKKNLDKSVNAEISVRQSGRASATNRDQNFVS